jgi:hypothetical protein
MSFLSPLRAKKVEEKELPLFKPEKLALTKSEARKILLYSADLSHSQIHWTQNWLSQRIRERSLPPQLAGADAFGQIVRFLAPHDASALLAEIRAEFLKTVPPPPKDDFLSVLANEAYHECQDQPHSSSRNSQKSDDDL